MDDTLADGSKATREAEANDVYARRQERIDQYRAEALACDDHFVSIVAAINSDLMKVQTQFADGLLESLGDGRAPLDTLEEHRDSIMLMTKLARVINQLGEREHKWREEMKASQETPLQADQRRRNRPTWRA